MRIYDIDVIIIKNICKKMENFFTLTADKKYILHGITPWMQDCLQIPLTSVAE